MISWLMLTEWAVKKLQGILLDYVTIDCAGKSCFGFAAVHRVNFALGLFHFVMAMLLVGVNNSKDRRAPIQNGFWGPKIIIWLGLIVGSFFLPNTFFEVWGNYVAFAGAILFLLLGLVLLVDLAHTFAEYCIEKIEDTESGVWRGVLIGSTLTMYLGSLAMTIVMYIYFAKSGCSMNQAAISVSAAIRHGGTRTDNVLDQPSTAHWNQRHGHPPNDPSIQSSRGISAIRNSRNLLHLSHDERGSHGAGRPVLQSSCARHRHTNC